MMCKFSIGDYVLKTRGIAQGFEGIVISNSYAGPLVKFLGWSGAIVTGKQIGRAHV